MLKAPAKQSATETISTLSGRLANATLLEDRRAAILGLRSFAKEYPASVASGALRTLIGCLRQDVDDVDTIKVVLETLLMLFNPLEGSPEASEDIALWLADELSQRQDNITILIDFLGWQDFYTRLYSLQLIQAVSSNRPARTQECILAAPLGTTRLVETLDDSREAIRNAGLLLLTDVTQESIELQKLVAFENTFDRVFKLIEAEGSLEQGGIIVQDCLALLANLVRFNASNQSLFRESGGAAKLSSLLPGSKTVNQTNGDAEDDWVSPQADKNLWGLLAIIRMFLIEGSISTQPNQMAFSKHGILQKVLDIAFSDKTALFIQAEALKSCADMIRGNPRLQEGFAQLQVPQRSHHSPQQNGDVHGNGLEVVYVIDALLDLSLGAASGHVFDARFAACECIKAYFCGHLQIKMHFLHRAIEGHTSGQDRTENILSTLLAGDRTDPYQIWFAAVLCFNLIWEDEEAKSVLMGVVEGDAESGEEVVTYIQNITGRLISSIQSSEDQRIIVAYLMLLSGWLFEDASAVNDFLDEGSSLQSLVQAASMSGSENVVVRGLCATLLGIIYMFSTKDSPIPRRELQPILLSKLGRERYLDALQQFRKHHLIRDFEVQGQASTSLGAGLPDVFFDTLFVEFIKDNISRISRAIDRDPGIEIHQSDEGVDRDLVDGLRSQIDEKISNLKKAEADLLSMERRLVQEQADHRKTQESATSEVSRIKNVNDALHRNHAAELQNIEKASENTVQDMESRHRETLNSIQQKMQISEAEAKEAVNKAKITTRQELQNDITRLNNAQAELQQKLHRATEDSRAATEKSVQLERDLKRCKSELEGSAKKLAESEKQLQSHTASLKEVREEIKRVDEMREKLKTENEQLRTKAQDQIWAIKDAEEKARKAEQLAKEKEEAKDAVQTELDDLFMVLSEIEEKRARDKKRLKSVGEDVSDAEDEDGEDDDDAEDEEDESSDHAVEEID